MASMSGTTTRLGSALVAGSTNAAAPGPVVATPDRTELIERQAETTLLGRGAQVDEIAEVIAFLASDKAICMTGSMVAADGGRTAAGAP